MQAPHDYHHTRASVPKSMFDIKGLDYLLDQSISYPSIHTAVVSDLSGATLTFVDTFDTTSEAQNRRVRIVAALGTDAWRESVTSHLVRETGLSADDSGSATAMGRVECEFGRVLTLPVHGEKIEALDPILLVTLNGTADASWSSLQEKGCAVVEHLSSSIASIGDELKNSQTPPIMKYTQPRGR
ncbi:hypothetical protein RhiJN_22837 [Ceratobasidium sp. AG-Ba]|nr:hypothetical protein RhiJN_22837 [Ceratobasidium sp. AG-Ba]